MWYVRIINSHPDLCLFKGTMVLLLAKKLHWIGLIPQLSTPLTEIRLPLQNKEIASTAIHTKHFLHLRKVLRVPSKKLF